MSDRRPRLRFKAFRDDWNFKSIGSIADVVAGYAFPSKEMHQVKKKYQLIKMSNVYKSKLRLDRTPSYWDVLEEKQKKFLLKKDDIIITLTGTVGKMDYGYSVQIQKSDAYLLNQRLVLIRNKTDISNSSFINNVIKTSKFKYHFFSESKGGTGNQANVGIDSLKEIKLNFPSLPEQEKIADFLSTVDKKIQALTKKKDLLESYKKGVMQQIFKQEIRFKKDDGSDYPEWEDYEFENIYQFAKTNSLSRENLNYSDGEIYNIHYGDIHTKFKTRFDLNDENVPFVNSEIDTTRYSQQDYLDKGDLIIADASEDYNDIGKSIEVVNTDGKKVLAGLHTFLAKLSSDIVVVGFMSHYIQCWDYRYQVMRIAQGTKVLSISKNRMNKLSIKLPCPAEQTKIANFLSSLDDKINVVASKIDKMKEWKKGLLQQMFV